MTTYNVLKTFHVLAAVIWVGGATAFNILGTRLRRANDAYALARVAQEMAIVGNAVFLPASVVVLAMGVWMVLISGWDFEDVWVALGLVGVVATAITGSTVIGPRLKRIGDAIAERGAEDTRVQDDIGRLVAIARIDLVVLFLVVAVMVIKPGS